MIELDIELAGGIPFDISGFNTRGCLETRSLGSAGWDNTNVRLVFPVDFLENMLAFVQERGRAGMWQGTIPSTDEYIL